MKQKIHKEKERQPRKKLNGKRSINQKMWDYMRRNRKFIPRDMMTILKINTWNVRAFMHSLEIAGMVKKIQISEGRYKVLDSVYIFLSKEEIIQAPYVSSTEVYCYHTKRSIDIGANVLLKNALKHMGQNECARKIGVEKSTLSRVRNNTYPNPEHVYKKIREHL